MKRRIKVAIAGLGGCASALIQGLYHYQDAPDDAFTPGLMHTRFGPYHISDIDIVAVFDVNTKKIGKDVSEAIFAQPNAARKFADVPHMGVEVLPGPISDGVADHMRKSFFCYENDDDAVDVASVLKESTAEILVNLLPVGSDNATKIYAQAALDAGVAFANGIPSFIVSDGEWAAKFKEAGIPCAGDDIKSQLGATILHRVLMQLMHDRGIKVKETYQLNVGGNTDFENMKQEDRLTTKRTSKTQAVTSVLPYEVPTRIGPSDYVPFLKDVKICYLHAQGYNFGENLIEVQLKLSVQDSPNSAGVMIDVIRALAIAQDRNLSGPLYSVSAYSFKHPPRQIEDFVAKQKVEQYIKGEIDE